MMLKLLVFISNTLFACLSCCVHILVCICLHHIGPELVRLSTDEERANGSILTIDDDAIIRMTMLLFAMLNPTVICDNFKSKTVPDKRRILVDLGYEAMEKAIAFHTMESSCFMPSRNNLRCCKGRVASRATTWYCADMALVVPGYKLLGFTVTHIDGENGETKTIDPWTSAVDPPQIIASTASFTLDCKGNPINSTLAYLFGSNQEASDRYISSVSSHAPVPRTPRSGPSDVRSWCSSCFHKKHTNLKCIDCNSTVGRCEKKCKVCLHPPHEGICPQCRDVITAKSVALCVHVCRGCSHLGKTGDHFKRGCKECGDNEGCNALLSVAIDDISEGHSDSACDGVLDDNDNDGGDEDVNESFTYCLQNTAAEDEAESLEVQTTIAGVCHDDELIAFRVDAVDFIRNGAGAHGHSTRFRSRTGGE